MSMEKYLNIIVLSITIATPIGGGLLWMYSTVATKADIEAAAIESEKRDIDLQVLVYNNELREYTEEGLSNLSDTERQNYDDMIKQRDGLQNRKMLLLGVPTQ